MPTIQYTIVFGVLLTEMVLFLLLIIPFPSSWRKKILLWFAKFASSPNSQPARYAVYFVYVLVLILFADAVRSMMSYQERYTRGQFVDERAKTQLQKDLFYAERNFYLTGFTLFLSLILNQFTNIILSIAIDEEKNNALISQVKKQGQDYLALLDENKKLKEGPDGELGDLKKEVEELKKENKTLKADLEASKKNVEAIKSQASSTSKEYDRLLAEHASLQDQLERSENKKDA